MRGLKREIFLSFFILFIFFIIILVGLKFFITKIIIYQEVSKARLEADTIYYFREYISKVSPYVKITNKNFSFFACTPAYVTNQTAKLIRDKEHFYVRQVSDRYRDPNDKPIKPELYAIEYFKKHKNAKEFWQIHSPHEKYGIGADKKHIFYAYPLWIEKSCLKCHGVPYKDVPPNLYNKLVEIYGNRAFNYKLGDLRGIISIRIPYENIKKRIDFVFFLISVFIFILFIIFGFVFFRIYKNIQKDTISLINYFKNIVLKEKYNIFRKKMYFVEFEILKEQINKTIKLIKQYQRELKKKMYFNNLTNISNRNKLVELLKYKSDKIIVLLNVDKFSEINSVFGIKTGDELIKLISNRLKKLSKKYKFSLFHIDIDEFGLIFDKKYSRYEIEKIVEKILKILEEPYKINDNEIDIRFRAGISEIDYIHAEMALNYAKELKKDIVLDNDISHLKDVYNQNIYWLKKIKEAIKEDRIVPFYQPIVNKDKKIVKYEALVRMIERNGEIISPFYFLEIAKKSRLYSQIASIMINKVMKVIRENKVSVSINLSLEDIENEKIKSNIIAYIINCQYKDLLTFEIVENEDVRDSEVVMNFIKEIKKYGAKIYIDDFGSGYANFDYLLKLGADGVKIDGSLVRNILNDTNSEIIVKLVVEFAKQTGIKVVAEFVENEEIFEKLKSLGVDYFQGYYFSPPKPDIKE